MLRSLEYLACYYISGSYWTQEYGYCTNTKHIRDLAYAVSFLPYYWRAMQATEFFPAAECRVLNSECLKCIVGWAVRKAVVRRGGHEPPGEPGQVRLRRLAMAGRGLGWLATMYS